MPLASNVTSVLLGAALGCAVLHSWPGFIALGVLALLVELYFNLVPDE